MDFDAAAQVVAIRRADGKTAELPLTLLAESDRQYILNWGVKNAFMHRLKISVTPHLSDVSSEDTSTRGVDKVVSNVKYTIFLENPASSPLEKTVVEYCIFYRQGKRDGNTVHYDEGVFYGKSVVEGVNPSSSITVETNPITLYTINGNLSLFGQMSSSEANVWGIWLRLKMVLPAGDEMIREFRTSEDESWKWTAYSIAAGMNEGYKPGPFNMLYR
jgi:hypothetical protein